MSARSVVAALLIGLQLFGLCVTVAFVGKPRKPITGGTAALSVVITAAAMLAIYWLWAS